MTISFLFLSETLTMILCKASQDTEGSYQQMFCRNLSGADYCHLYNVAIPFRGLCVSYDQNMHKRQQGLPAAKHRSDQDSRLKSGGIFSFLEDRMMTSGDRQDYQVCSSPSQLPQTVPSRIEAPISVVFQIAMWVPWLPGGAYVGISCYSDKADLWIHREPLWCQAHYSQGLYLVGRFPTPPTTACE